MLAKIEKIARVKPIDYDFGRRFDSRDDSEKNSSFLQELKRAIAKKIAAKTSKIPDAYRLEITEETPPALFYFGGSDITGLLK